MEKNRETAHNPAMDFNRAADPTETGNSPARVLLSPEEIAVRAGQQVPYFHLPERSTVFAQRAARLRQLAGTPLQPHPMRDYLLFIAELATAQQASLNAFSALPTPIALPDFAALDAAAASGMPPLPALYWPRDPAWRQQLRTMLADLLPRLQGSPAASAVQSLQQLDDQALEQQAGRLLGQVTLGLDLATAPLLAAGLQVYWTHLVLATEQLRSTSVTERGPSFGRTADATTCPCCGSAPTASLSRVDASGSGFRYLVCSLCATGWHMVRVKCSHCESTKGIHYESLRAAAEPLHFAARAGDAAGSAAMASHGGVDNGGSGVGSVGQQQLGKPAIEAETCDVCRHYLKIVRMDRDLAVEPVADDLASLTLDLLVSEAGYQRHGANLMLFFGDPGDADDPARTDHPDHPDGMNTSPPGSQAAPGAANPDYGGAH